ncbi:MULTISPECIES: ABC-type transport auxiliary lipoprotein family protein [Pseudovibrio]|uniref:ABC-type transport auxiliary lipoprotein family protein n=1 Tax=Stappiaceae TaxID=2821832 RepID=UPI002365BF8A|nr:MULTISPECIES: ABC-type transport auxiliary lipoprotein family protein [Pseudovibrio]MDD7910409.1 ABC-type transport auxiliary lipoprotein family protein [Pseudovibrio exalbescens]MDX5594124.1 ABC-type transport auxiliary lipoprotein family protein [Pseudovibrio sp. SPO723]
MNTSKLVKGMAVALIVGATAACGSTGPSALYDLTAPREFGNSARSSNVQILVPTPVALQALDTNSIAVAEAGRIYSYYPRVAWADSLPNVFQAKLIETLENTGKFRGVSQPGQGLLIDYQLQTTVRAFEVNVGQSARAYVEIAARLVNDRDGRSVQARVFAAEVPTVSDNTDQSIDALNQASDQVLREIAAWVLKTV